jgi:LmbE family N-acetylglucosaminyl deacetylase
MCKNEVILVVAAHPDDEVLGCGGTLKCLTDKHGKDIVVHCLILTEPLTSRGDATNTFDAKSLEGVIEDSRRAAKLLGISHSYYENLPQNRLDSMNALDINKIIEGYIERIKPTTIFTHHKDDLNLDHRITSRAVLTACRPTDACPVKQILTFEVPSSTEWAFPIHKTIFSPNVFTGIGDAINAKIDAMQMYETERRAYPHPRSPEALRATAIKWGSVVGLNCAEAFELLYARHEI